MPALLASVRNARRATRTAVAFRRRIHPDADDEAKDRGACTDAGRPDDGARPPELVSTQRREIQPVRNRPKVGAHPRSRGRVLDDFA